MAFFDSIKHMRGIVQSEKEKEDKYQEKVKAFQKRIQPMLGEYFDKMEELGIKSKEIEIDYEITASNDPNPLYNQGFISRTSLKGWHGAEVMTDLEPLQRALKGSLSKASRGQY